MDNYLIIKIRNYVIIYYLKGRFSFQPLKFLYLPIHFDIKILTKKVIEMSYNYICITGQMFYASIFL